MTPLRTTACWITTLSAAVVVAASALPQLRAQSATPPGLADPVTIKISRADLMIIGQGLQELPAKTANPVLNALQVQLAEADRQAAEAAKKAAEPKPEEKPAKDTPKKP